MSRFRLGNHSPLMLVPHLLQGVQTAAQKKSEQLPAWCAICDAPCDKEEVIGEGSVQLARIRVECRGDLLAMDLGEENDRVKHARLTHQLRKDVTDGRDITKESDTEDAKDATRRALRIPFFGNAATVTDVANLFGADSTVRSQ